MCTQKRFFKISPILYIKSKCGFEQKGKRLYEKNAKIQKSRKTRNRKAFEIQMVVLPETTNVVERKTDRIVMMVYRESKSSIVRFQTLPFRIG